MIKKRHTVVFLLLTSLFAKAGEWEDYYALLRKHQEAKQLNGSVVTRYFYEGNKTPLKTEHGSFVIDGSKKYVNYEGHLLIQNEKYNITVDRENKVVMVNNALKEESNDVIKDIGTFGKDSARFRNSVSLVNTKNDQNSKVFELKFNSDKTQYEKIIVEFASKSGLVKKISYLWRKSAQYKSNPVKVEIDYAGLASGNPASKSTFSEEQVARIKGDNIKPLKLYEDYKVIDYRNIQKYAE